MQAANSLHGLTQRRYIGVGPDKRRQLYYVLVKAEDDQNGDAPLILWLNGGPGCSSLGGGLMSELGPFYPRRDRAGLQLNKHRWTQVANIVFLESPAFVGFSYSDDPADATVGDDRTTQDAVEFVASFLERHDELASRDLYISGESYGGHYVPKLAAALLAHNNVATVPVSLQGFFVGNAWTDPAYDNRGAVDFWWAHALVSDEAARGIVANCDFASLVPLVSSNARACQKYVNMAYTNMGGINIYDIYVDVCVPRHVVAPAQVLARGLGTTPAGMLLGGLNSPAHETGYDPCIDDEVAIYLNRPDVQAAMHANGTGRVPGPWQDCSPLVQYSMRDLLSSAIDVYKKLLRSDLTMWVYSGDVDAIVPVIGTRRWIASLGLNVTSSWRPWYVDGQVGGYVEERSGLTLATVRNAGHMVPYTQPQRSLQLLKLFLAAARGRTTTSAA